MGSYNIFSFWMLFSLMLFLFLESADLTMSCRTECGGIKIMYPFGVGEGCYMEKWYEIECNTSPSGKQVPFLSLINREVVNISLPIQFTEIIINPGDPLLYGAVRIKHQITSKGCSSDGVELGSLLNLTGIPFYVSQRNTLTAVGCNNKASLTNVEPSIVGCQSSCGTKDNLIKDYLLQFSYYNYDCDQKCIREEYIYRCTGNKCCKAVMPDRVQQIVGVRIDDNTTTGGCKVAFLSDEAFSSSDPQRLHAKGYSTVERGWFFHTSNRSYLTSLGCCNSKGLVNLPYSQRKTYSCACDYDAILSYARCSCNEGYEGNPYLLNGCRDIDECQRKTRHGTSYCDDIKDTCVNSEGGYECVYTNHRPLAIGLGASFGSLIFVSVMYWLYKIVRKQRKLNQKKKFFKRNGGILLQQQLGSTEDNNKKTKVFSSRELEKATQNCSSNRILGQGGQGTVYKGILVDGRIVAVKKSKAVDEDKLEEFINEVVILSHINHRNIVKLLGCCLETNVPVLVY